LEVWSVDVTQTAVERIRELVASGSLAPGVRLPPEPELAAQLGISRGSLREAVRVLAHARVLDVRRGDGTYVTSLEPSLLLSGLSFVTDLMQGPTLLEVFEVRRLLEPAATALAAERIGPAQIDELRASLARMRASSDPTEQISLDVEFHALVAASTGNQTLCTVLKAMSTRALRARMWRGYAESSKMTWSLDQHDQIITALEARNATLAQAAATVHLAASEGWLKEFVREEALAVGAAIDPAELAVGR
jgi:GntR family transcriptional regulator, transcriptional repressor for pyruvate dehydrogenase complex